MRKINKYKSFTLLELMVVIIIIGILGTLGFSQYTAMREQTLVREAQANLRLIAAAERIARMESAATPPSFVACGNTAECNTVLRLSMNAQNWQYSVVATPDTFTATANRVAGGNNNQCQMTQANTDPHCAIPVAGDHGGGSGLQPVAQ